MASEAEVTCTGICRVLPAPHVAHEKSTSHGCRVVGVESGKWEVESIDQ